MIDLISDRRRIGEALRQSPLICGSVAYEPIGSKSQRHSASGAPLVSIITVTYNAKDSIEGAIRSVAEQSYANIEYIIIDGGSTDDTLKAIYQNINHVDCLVSEPDQGIYDAMNKGLLRARGAYVALLNADDRLFVDFVSQSVERLEATGADISYCDYVSDKGLVHIGEINDGLFLSQLGIKHNTFLMRRECFAQIGGFDSNLRIVADAKWNRAAYAVGLQFTKVEGVHVYYSSQGLSAALTDDHRKQVIFESRELLGDCFPCLDHSESEKLYLSNFNPRDADMIIRIAEDQGIVFPCLDAAIRESLRWNLAWREGYQLRPHDQNQICQLIGLARAFGIPLTTLKVVPLPNPLTAANAVSDFAEVSGEVFEELFATIERIASAREKGRSRVCLHFTRVFSAPSETFIYDFLKELSAAEPNTQHVMLCDERQNEATRPYDLVLTVPWSNLAPTVRRLLYDLIWERLVPSEVVAHFALNGWWLHQRLREEQRHLPWVNMCHGIDVFTINDTPDYRAYVTRYCAEASHVALTTVSSFLTDLLIDAGVPRSKIFKVPNAVSPVFFENRKTDGFWDGTRPLRVVTVGRLIDWKGQDYLLHALAQLRSDDILPDFELEVVYGGWSERLELLKSLCVQLGISKMVRFVEFVDFNADPGYLARFDLFVLPSTLSTHEIPRTETFGVAMIEAIMAGLPVIGTDAGGLPEIIGSGGAQAVVVPHGDAKGIAEAIATMLRNHARVFRENTDYAQSRAPLFSSEARLGAWSKAKAWHDRPRRRILHFCALGNGGAAGASLNVHRGFLRRGYDSWFVTRDTEVDRLPRFQPNIMFMKAELSVDFSHNEIAPRSGLTTFSPDDHAISDSTLQEIIKGAELINVTWPAKFLSVHNIAMLTHLGVPVAITLRDMNPITGGCHFFHGCDLWRSGCSGCPQIPDNSDNYPALVLAAKKAAWNLDNTTFIALSDNTMKLLEGSSLTAGAKKVKLGNYCDEDVFYPDSTPFAFEFPPLPEKSLKIGYLPSFGSRVKGDHLIMRVLKTLQRLRPELEIVLFLVASHSAAETDCPYQIVQIDKIHDPNQLRAFYNSVDLVVVPSLEETFSNTTLEALFCGTPVAGFKTGVLEEILTGGPTGLAVEVGNVEALAKAILHIACNSGDRVTIARMVTSKFDQESAMTAYEKVFRGLIESPHTGNTRLSEPAINALKVLKDAQERRKTKSMIQRLTRLRRSEAVAHNRLRSEKEASAKLRKSNKELFQKFSKILDSTSWKISAPLRFVVIRVRRVWAALLR